ncbi:unnamed protein product [Rhizoctonia solani]|uniref:Uncharacterized protein n=1 Tax=Rhizoctonia solani TaxID=456999 RepID=A0A8H2XSH9_9AGAM|nr:unnamed protein product [Rhizoctonia solani]
MDNAPELDDYGMPIEPDAFQAPARPEPGVLAEQSLARRKDGRIKLRGLAKSIDDFTGGDPGQIQALIDEVEAAATKVIETGSPLTRKLVQHTKNAYEVAVKFLSGDSCTDPWVYQAVKEYSIRFIELRARVAKGKGGGLVKAETVLGWYSCLLICIVKYTYDPDTGFKVGGKLLYKEQLASDLLDHVKNVTTTLKLDRHSARNKKTCGLPEARIMIEHLIRTSCDRGRLPRLQLIAVNIICLACGIRPSSLCAGSPEDKADGKYMKMGDIQLWNRGQFAIDVELNVENLKGHNSTVLGRSMNIWLRALTKSHNIIFDTFWIVSYIWARGCLAAYPELPDLLTTKDAQLVITSPDEPFLCTPNQGATKLLNTPWSAKGLSGAMSGLGRDCRLEGVTMYAYRRGFAQKMAMAIGHTEASMAMGHKDGESVLSRHYSNGAGNYNLLGIMVGEATDQYRPGAETALQMRVRVGTAVTMLSKVIAQSTRIDDSDDEDSEPEVEVDEVVDADEELQELKRSLAHHWTLYLDTFGRGSPLYAVADGYKKTKISIILKITSHKLYTEAAKDQEFLAQAKKAENALREVNERYQKCSQGVLKRGKIEAKDKLDKKRAKETKASIQDTDAALGYLKETPELLNEASKKASAASLAPSAPRPSGSKTSTSASKIEAEKAIQDLSRDEEEDDQGEVTEVYKELGKFKPNNLAGKKHGEAFQEAMDGTPDEPEGEWKDKDEPERIPLASAYDMRVSLATLALDPILFQREMEAQIKADGGKILCQKCRLYCEEGEEPHNFKTLSSLKRHMWQQHTEWSELIPKMECGDCFMCPGSCGSKQQFDSIEKVYKHCLSDDCPDNEAFKMMETQHNLNHDKRYKEQKKYEQEGGNARARTVHDKKYLQYLRGLTEDDLLELADIYEVPRERVQPHIPLMLRNLHFLAES